MNNTARPAAPTVPPMGSGSPSPSPTDVPMRERVARMKTLLRRGLGYWKVSLLLLVVVGAVTFWLAKNAPRTYRADCVLEVHGGTRSEGEGSQASMTAERLNAMAQSRDSLEAAIKAYKLFPKTVDNKSLKDAADEMKPSVGVRAGKGGLYTLGFQLTEIEGRDTRALVRDVTQFLGDELVKDWTSSYKTDFLRDKEEKQKQLEADVVEANNSADEVNAKLSVFRANHPQYQPTATGAPSNVFAFGTSEGPAAKQAPKDNRPVEAVDPELQRIYQNDLKLSGLWREKQLLQGQIKAASPSSASPVSGMTVADLQKQIDAAQGELDAAQATLKQKEADFQSKAATLGTEHYDYKTAQAARDAAAGAVQEKRTKLAGLQAALKQAQSPAPVPTSTDPYSGATLSAELAKLKDVNGEISARMEALKSQYAKTGTAPAPTPSVAPTTSAPVATSSLTPQQKREKEIVDNEVTYRRLMSDLKSWQDKADAYAKEAEKTKTMVQDAQRTTGNLIAIKEPPELPLAPFASKRMTYFTAGMALAFILALLYPAARVAMNDVVIDAQDIEGLQLIPVLGVVPRIHMTANPPDKEQSGAQAAANRGATGAV